MSHSSLVLVACAALLLSACVAAPPAGDGANPLLAEWDTPFGVPPFGAIETGHFEPAFAAAMKEQLAEIAAIVSNPEAPSFANTVEALERSGELLDRVRLVFVNLSMAHTNDELQAVAKTVNPALAAHSDDIFLDEGLFARVKEVYEGRDALQLDAEQGQLLDKTYKRFVRGGAELEPQAKLRMRELNGELSSLTTQFGENLLKDMNAVALLLEDEAELAGLPQPLRDAAARLAAAEGHPGAWAFNLQRSSWTPFVQSSTRRDLRQKLYTAYTLLGHNGGETDNAAIASRIAALRSEHAALLGYRSHAHYRLEPNMAESPERVEELLAKLWQPALARATAERDELQQLARVDDPGFDLEMWDWWFYAEKLRAAKYDFDEAAVQPYLELESVRGAAFGAAGRLWGLQFVERPDVPTYHPDVRAWEVTEADGEPVGLLFTDYFARSSKRGGAWMENYRYQWRRTDGSDVRPVIVNVCNFTKPADGQPALLSLDEGGTLFHEFGHALHGLLADGTYARLSGTSVARDFVELPSQMMENWAFDPEYLPTYARHVETGQPIPDELVAKLQRARQFNQGFATTEYLAASFLDLRWHSLGDGVERDALVFEAEVMAELGLIPEIMPRYRTTYFGHIFSGEYAAGYYAYVWAEVLDADGFEAFKEAGIFDPETAESYRRHILAAGASEPPMELFTRFRGAEPSIDALLVRRGLDPA